MNSSASRSGSGSSNEAFRSNPEYIKERRRVIRENHPDLGGSDAALIEALQKLDLKWHRKSNPNAQLRDLMMEHRPSFVSEQELAEAFEMAERIQARIQQGVSEGFADGKKFGDKVRKKVVAGGKKAFKQGQERGKLAFKEGQRVGRDALKLAKEKRRQLRRGDDSE